MLRRPPHGEGRHVHQRKKLWAVVAILLPFAPFVDATDFHQQQSVDPHPYSHPHTIASPSIAADHGTNRERDRDRDNKQSSPLEGDRVNRNLAATALPHNYDLIDTPHNLIKTPEAALRRKSTYTKPESDSLRSLHPRRDLNTYSDVVSHDASASSATAPDLSVVAPPSRRLEDWEVEDFVLLATIDGDLYAADRKTGKQRWHMILDKPMVETIHHRANKSTLDSDLTPLDQTIWAVEPTRDGQIYMWAPGADKGLVYTGLSMKKLVDDFGPYKNEALSLVYTGDKKTTLMTLDAATGRAIQWHGSTAAAADELTCARPQDVVAGMDAEECSATITLGRTEYTVGISSTRGFPIATLKFSEWSPNVFDQDLLRQYSSTKDNVYITSQHDGQAYAFDYVPKSGRSVRGRSYAFSPHLPSPIAKAFDIMRPAGSSYDGEDNEALLIALPQPPPPPGIDQEEAGRDKKIFLNQTDGNWYAMSGRAYPLITLAPPALINQAQWFAMDEPLTSAELSRALVGQHTLDATWSRDGQHSFPSLPGSADPVMELDQPDRPDNPTLAIDAPDPSSTVINIVKKLPQDAVNYTVDLIRNPVIIIICSVLVLVYRKELNRRIREWWQDAFKAAKMILKQRGYDIDMDDDLPEESPEIQEPPVQEAVNDQASPEQAVVAPVDLVDTPPVGPQDQGVVVADVGEPTPAGPSEEANEPEVKKKKNHRGRRGGKNHKKKKISPETSIGDGPGTSVEEAVDIAKNIGERRTKGPEPNIQTLPYEVDEVSNPTLRIDDSLEVNEDQQLGTGSNGTVVYAGKWQDRPVAVKRMLRDFYDIASQETRLLREVDRHQNVIQYFAQLERGNFIYIALELCEASLADVMEKPSQFRQLADAGAKDTLAVLKQITKGLDHLHSLQIGKCPPPHLYSLLFSPPTSSPPAPY